MRDAEEEPEKKDNAAKKVALKKRDMRLVAVMKTRNVCL